MTELNKANKIKSSIVKFTSILALRKNVLSGNLFGFDDGSIHTLTLTEVIEAIITLLNFFIPDCQKSFPEMQPGIFLSYLDIF